MKPGMTVENILRLYPMSREALLVSRVPVEILGAVITTKVGIPDMPPCSSCGGEAVFQTRVDPEKGQCSFAFEHQEKCPDLQPGQAAQ
jgi:hypothetical protein